MKFRRPGAWLFPALLYGALLLQIAAGCGTSSSGSSAGSLSPEEQIKEAIKTAERARETAVARIKAKPTMAQNSNLRWVSAGGGGPRGMEALDLPGNEPVRPWFSGPPWVLAEGAFYFQDPVKAAGSDERSWYKLTPTGMLRVAESAQPSEREQILAVLDHVRFMLWADPLWVIEHMEIREAGGLLQDAEGVIGSSLAGRIPNPDTYAPELQAARALLEGSSDTWQTPQLGPGGAGGLSASLEIDRQGRPTILQYRGPDGLVWEWEFARTSEEVSAPSGAVDWLPSGP